MHKEHSESAGQKREYQAPLLTRYGALRDLTQSGNGSNTESTKGSSGNCFDDITKKPCTSDSNAKENIVRIGEHPLGIGLYLFDYKPGFRDHWGHGRQFGVMAQEVEAVMPEAVCTHPDGYRMVYYGMLGISRANH
jgi:hypothetical protein